MWTGVFAILSLCAIGTSTNKSPAYINQFQNAGDKYLPTWKSLDSRPLPEWFDKAKIGIFLHWGVFSVPSFGGEWFWMDWKGSPSFSYVEFMRKNYPPNFTYQDFAKDFTAEFFEPKQWAELFRKSGAKYVVLTSKHHEGYTLWPSKYSFSWNAKDVGPKRDLVGDLADAIRSSTDLHFGLYHSLYEWFNPMYLKDKSYNFTQDEFSKNKIIPEMVELVNLYKPEVLWSDGDWETTDEYWHAKEFLAWLYNSSPVKDTVVVNDRWGQNIPCHHGDFYSCSDRYNPGVLQSHKWENAMTIDKRSWGFRRNAPLSDYYTIEGLIETMIQTVSCGGNLLMNIGPAKDGTIAPIFQERLLQMGEWLGVNGEAIYESKPWTFQNETSARVWYTSKENGALYATVLDWPQNNRLTLTKVAQVFQAECTVTLLGQGNQNIKYARDGQNVIIEFPDMSTVKSKWAWVIKITH